MKVYLMMNKRGQFWGPGGWVAAERARFFSAEDALEMLKVFKPEASIISTTISGYESEPLVADPRFVASLA